jgi:hypothetical protein
MSPTVPPVVHRCPNYDTTDCRCLLPEGHQGPHDHSYTPYETVVTLRIRRRCGIVPPVGQTVPNSTLDATSAPYKSRARGAPVDLPPQRDRPGIGRGATTDRRVSTQPGDKAAAEGQGWER